MEAEELLELFDSYCSKLYFQGKNLKESVVQRIGQGGSRRSLSELEFQELKGFIDFGFIFSEEDMDSSLASIIPGLQRSGRVDGKKEENGDGKYGISRPYLSEVWGVTDQTKLKNPLMDWRSISDLRNKIDMKDHLRVWAQTVASSVK
ncbi:hypothetical protein LguiA_035076 [Lonicera macranthoides]